jgi:hypothetical protein
MTEIDHAFEIRYDRWCGWMMGVLGMGRGHSGVEVGADAVDVTMGWAFRSSIPRSAIQSVAPDDGRVWGWGVHGWRGRWLVNGSSQGVVRFELDPAVASKVCGVRVGLTVLRVSVADRDALLAALV